MVDSCCVCRKEYCSLFPRQFHSFPIDAERRKKWFQSIGHNINAYKHARICSDHFTEDDYNRKNKRLKETAIPSVFTQKFYKNVKKELIIETQHDNEYDSTSSIQCDNQNKSIMDIQHKSTMDIQHDNQNESIDIQYEFPMGVQNEVIVFSEPTHVIKSDTSQKRKWSNINKIHKMFLKIGKYNTECFKRSEFVTEQSWNKFVKHVHYNKYLNRLLLAQKKRLQKNTIAMESVIQTLKNTSSVTNNTIRTPQEDDIVLFNTILSDEYVRNEQELNKHRMQQEVNVKAKQDFVNVYMDHDYFIRNNWYLTEYVEIVITYISDYIVSTVIKKINCIFCKQLLISSEAQKESDTCIDELCQASCDVIEICKTAEKILRHNQDKLFKTDNILDDLICQSLCALSSHIFNMSKHTKRNFRILFDHRNQLIQLILKNFFNVRLKHEITFANST